jgi:ATP-dependent Clp protease adaptor protein ClpS
MPKTEIKPKIAPLTDIKEPPFYKVIYFNDNITSMEFVVGTLINYFDYTDQTASTIAKNIHEQGSAVVAILPHEIAEQLGIEVTLEARSMSFPLQIKIEAEVN